MSANQNLWYLWQTSARMAMEVPLVMSQRIWMFSQPWDEKTMAEYQLMFAEKAQGWGEVCANLATNIAYADVLGLAQTHVHTAIPKGIE